MRKIFSRAGIIIVFTFFGLVPLFSQHLIDLKEIAFPHCMAVFNNHIYILEKGTVYVYRTDSDQLVRKFGGCGEGPGETRNFPSRGNMLIVNKQGVYIDGMQKMVLFSHRGDLLKEVKKPHKHFYVLPMGNNWVTLFRQPDEEGLLLSVALCDDQFNIIKKFGAKRLFNKHMEFDLIPDAFNFCVDRDVLFIELSEIGFLIESYSTEGAFINRIEENPQKIKISDEEVESVFDGLESDPEIRAMGGVKVFRQKEKYRVPEFFPPIKNITCNSGNLFVKTFGKKNNGHLFYVYTRGKRMGKGFLPYGVTDNIDDQLTGRMDRHYVFSGDFYYYLSEDSDKELWQVNRVNWRKLISVDL